MKSKKFVLKSAPKSRKLLVLVAVLALVLVTSVSGLIYIKARQNKSNLAEQKAKDEAQTESSKDTSVKQGSDKNTTGTNLPTNSTNIAPSDVPTSTKLEVAINAVTQQAGKVEASATISGANNSGTCVFTFTIAEERPVIRQVSSNFVNPHTCSMTASEVEFSKVGVWNLKVIYYLNNTKAEATKNVTIN